MHSAPNQGTHGIAGDTVDGAHAQRRYDPQRPLISVHVPKCAGSSFRDVLKSWFGPGFRKHYVDEKRNAPPVIHDLAALAGRPVCIHGHFNYRRGNGAETYYPEVDQFITIVREPFDLHLSNYFYAKRLQSQGLLRRAGTAHASLADVDLATYLSKRRRSFLPSFFPPELTPQNCDELLDQRYLFVGVFEDIQTSVDQLADQLGFGRVQIKHTNSARRNEEVPHSAYEIFRQDNQLAYAIYEHALRRVQSSSKAG